MADGDYERTDRSRAELKRLQALIDREHDVNLPKGAVRRPWGWYITTLQMPGYKTKVFVVGPGQRLSLQSHTRRKEMWSIVKGEGLCTVGSNLIQVSENSLISVPVGAKHRIENLSPTADLVVSEVQIGDYVEEDDIVRYEDDYGRSK